MNILIDAHPADDDSKVIFNLEVTTDNSPHVDFAVSVPEGYSAQTAINLLLAVTDALRDAE